MKKIILFLIMQNILGCASYDEVTYKGMSKLDFVDKTIRNEMDFRSVYFDSETGIEVLLPERNVKGDLVLNETAKIAVFENVTLPRPEFTYLTMRVPEGYCQNFYGYCYFYGDGVLKESFSVDELIEMSANGHSNAELLLAIIQLDEDIYNEEVSKIMEVFKISREDAERKHKFANIDRRNKFQERKRKIFEMDKLAKKNKRRAKQPILYTSQPKDEHDLSRKEKSSKSSTSTIAGKLASSLINIAFEAYLDKEFGLDKSRAKYTSEDMENVRDAYRRKIKNERKKKQLNNLKWTAPIR